jgi:Na+/melibiose symporter-like transporter
MAQDGGKPSSGKLFLAQLGLPAFALSLGITIVAALLPVLVQAKAGPLVAGALVALEGVFALVVPPLIGGWADRAKLRLPLIAGAGLLGAASLVLIALDGSLLLLALWMSLFVVAYYAYLTPYLSLYPELVDDDERGRSQGSQGTWREIGLALALIAGPTLIAIWRPAPFLLAAAVLVVITPLFGAVVARRRRERGSGPESGEIEEEDEGAGAGQILRRVRDLVREEPAIGRFVAANALWEAALAGLRAFVVLFFTVGLGRPASFVSIVMVIVAIAAVSAAPASGWLADRFGRRPVMLSALA